MMRKTAFSLRMISALLIVLVGIAPSAGQTPRNMKDLELAISGLLTSNADDAFLIVTIAGSEDFVQMSAYRGSAVLDFPQIQDRQKQLRPKIEKTCAALGLTLNVVHASSGSVFLDYDLPSDAAEVARMLRRILIEVYDASESTVLEFETNGFYLSDA